MKKSMLLLVIFFMVFGMVGCTSSSTTGGAIGNLLPAPKITKGVVNQGIYSWGIADTSSKFNVMVPQYVDANEYQYMQFKEQRDNTMSYVSFGPAAYDQNIYRISIIKKIDNTPFDVRATNALNYITGTLVDGYGATFEKIAVKNISFKGHQAVLTVAKLTSPKATFINVNYVIDQGNFVVLLSGDLYPKPDQSINVITNSILQNTNKTWISFVNSYRILN